MDSSDESFDGSESLYSPSSSEESSEEEVVNPPKAPPKIIPLKKVVEEVMAEGRRKKKQCPVEGCSAVVTHLPRHLRAIHKWTTKSAQNAVQAFQLRSGLSSTDRHKFKTCPVQGCGKIVKRLPQHMRLLHNGAKATSSHRNPLPPNLVAFATWLMSPDGGSKSARSANQHANQVNTVTHDAPLTKDGIKGIFLEGYCIRQKFLPGTIRSYLASLKHYISFLNLTADIAEQQGLSDLQDVLSRWIASYRKANQKRILQKMDEDLNHLITPKDIQLFKDSKAASEAIRILEHVDATEAMPLPQRDFVLVRDFIMASIILINANRTGVIANMTIKEVACCKDLEGVTVISVKEHKTAHITGPAKVVVTAEIKKWLSSFITIMRTQVQPTSDAVFLSWQGKAMESSQVCKAVQSIWMKAGLPGVITCTLMRKTAVTQVHEKCPEQSSNLSDLMCHRLATAAKCYRLVQREKSAVQASKALSGIMETQDSGDEGPSGCGNIKYDIPHNRGKRIFDSHDKETLRSCCMDIIHSGPIGPDRVRAALEKTEEGRAMLLKYKKDQLINRLKYERRQDR